LIFGTLPPANAASPVGKMTTRGAAEVNGAPAPSETSVFAGDRITTREDTAAAVQFSGGSQIFLPELSAAVVKLQDAQLAVSLERGALAVIARGAATIPVRAQGVVVEAAGDGAIFEVALKRSGLRVMARRGAAVVRAADRTVEVKEGMTMDATTAAPQAGATSGLTALQTVVLITSLSLGITGFALGIAAINRSEPQDCTVTGTTTPFQITCP
jgi:ferric-dicitrate binding protein FerR (iron transport regulator)